MMHATYGHTTVCAIVLLVDYTHKGATSRGARTAAATPNMLAIDTPRTEYNPVGFPVGQGTQAGALDGHAVRAHA